MTRKNNNNNNNKQVFVQTKSTKSHVPVGHLSRGNVPNETSERVVKCLLCGIPELVQPGHRVD